MSVNNVRINFTANVKDLQQSLKTAGTSVKKFGAQATKLSQTLSTRLSLPLAAVGGIALKQAANFEKLGTTLNVLTGSAEEGAKAFERLVQFSAKTPFQLDELVRANNTMMGFGLSADEAFNSLQQLGDIAAVAGGDLNRIAVAFGQSAAEGRVMTRDILQFINNGVPLYELLADVTGRTAGEVRELASEGKITFDVLQAALAKSTQEGGKFHGGMETLSGTLNGLFSTLKDNVNIAFAELGVEIAEAFNLSENIPKITEFIGDLVKKFKELDPKQKRFLVVATAIAGILPPLVLALSGVVTVVTTLAGGFKMLTMAIAMNPIGAAIVSIIALDKGLQGMNESLGVSNTRWQSFKNLVRSGGNIAKFAAFQIQTGTKIKKDDKDATEELAEEIEKMNSVLTKGLNRAGIGEIDLGLGPDAVTKQKITQEKIKNNRRTFLNDVFKITDENQQKLAAKSDQIAKKYLEPMESINTGLNRFNNRLEEQNDRTQAIINEQSAILTAGMNNLLVGIGESLGKAISTGANLGNLLATTILGTIGTVATQLGELAIKIGVGVLAVQKSLETLNPFVAIAAGIALVALGSMFRSRAADISKNAGGGVKKFAKGGIVSTPTMGVFGEYPGARQNPEVVAPLDRLKGMIGNTGNRVEVGGQFTLKGQDLVVALQRADRNRNRIK